MSRISIGINIDDSIRWVFSRELYGDIDDVRCKSQLRSWHKFLSGEPFRLDNHTSWRDDYLSLRRTRGITSMTEIALKPRIKNFHFTWSFSTCLYGSGIILLTESFSQLRWIGDPLDILVKHPSTIVHSSSLTQRGTSYHISFSVSLLPRMLHGVWPLIFEATKADWYGMDVIFVEPTSTCSIQLKYSIDHEEIAFWASIYPGFAERKNKIKYLLYIYAGLYKQLRPFQFNSTDNHLSLVDLLAGRCYDGHSVFQLHHQSRASKVNQFIIYLLCVLWETD